MLNHPLMAVAVAFWVWMVVDCWRNERDRGIWIVVMLLLFLAGAAAYFLFRFLPRTLGRGSSAGTAGLPSLARWFRRQEIARAEAAARNIGNAHQWFQLGELYREVGQTDQALQAFDRALEKDSEHLPSRWAAALLQMDRRRHIEAKGYLQPLIATDPEYKFGEAYLAYGEVLLALGELELAREHLEAKFKRFHRPEARLILADVYTRLGQDSDARSHLYLLIQDLRDSPEFSRDRHQRLLVEANRRLKSLSVEA